MSDVILYSVLSLGVIAAVSAMILFLTAKKFNVEEDPRIDEVNELLPGANCGGCGYPGCRGFAEALVAGADKGDISGLNCAPGGPDTMKAVGEFLGLSIEAKEAPVAVLRCGGTNAKTNRLVEYDGPASCAVAHATSSGEKGCQYGCLGLGDCVAACEFDAIYMDEETGLPVIIEEKCVGCGACAKACPRNIIEMRPRGRKDRRVWVSCMNRDKGAVAMKVCKAACIGCGKCAQVCPEKVQAITVENFLAYIDPNKCIACGKCIAVCPTKAIQATFELPKPKPKSVETTVDKTPPASKPPITKREDQKGKVEA